MTEFHETVAGRRFYEHTLPELVRQVSRLADAAERIADLVGKQQPQKEKNHDREEEPPDA